MISFKKIKIADQTTSLFQDNVENAFAGVLACLLIDGFYAKDIPMKSNMDTIVTHGLGRIANNYLCLGQNNPSTFWRSDTQNQDPTRTINLVSSNDVVVSFWIF